jgi:RimJ/RimL family protein N-acetyltransferase
MGDDEARGHRTSENEGPPEITAGALHLRGWTGIDASVLVAAYRDETMRAWLPFGFTIADEAAARRWINERFSLWEYGHRASYAICDATSGDVLGSIEVRDLSFSDQCTASYWVLPEHRGQNVAPHALGAMSRWAFTPRHRGGLGQHRMALTHAVGNHASCRVAAKAGFAFEGVMRASRRYADGRFHDEHLHARLAADTAVAAATPLP